MKLYFSPGACALGSQIALRAADVKFDLIKVDLKAKTSPEGDFWAVNPKGYIPYLKLDSGEGFSEAAVIMQWVADQNPDKNLFPKWGTNERYHAMEYLNFVATELHKGIGSIFDASLSEEAKDILRGRALRRLDFINQRLATNKWVLGEHFSIVDGYLYNMLRWTKPARLDISPLTHLLGFMERMELDPIVRASVEAEGLKL